MRLTALCLLVGLALVACAKDPPPSQYPQQPGYNPQQPQYPQQPQQYPQQPQPYPQQPQQPQQPQHPQQPAAGDGQPTAIPGVLKNANGTCSITPPSLTGQPVAPLVGPCPPGL